MKNVNFLMADFIFLKQLRDTYVFIFIFMIVITLLLTPK